MRVLTDGTPDPEDLYFKFRKEREARKPKLRPSLFNESGCELVLPEKKKQAKDNPVRIAIP